MGVDINAYLGIAMRCKVTQVITTIELCGCGNEACKKYRTESRDKFCSACGSSIISFKTEGKGENVDEWELAKKCNDRLMPISDPYGCKEFNGFHIYLPNVKIKDRKCYFDPKCDTVFEPITSQTIDQELKLFQENFAEEIKQCREAYGVENVEVGWYYINYFT